MINHSRMSPEQRAKLALELTMRDALGGLEELANLDVYRFDAECLQILSIEPPTAPLSTRVTALKPRLEAAKILNFPDSLQQKQRRAG